MKFIIQIVTLVLLIAGCSREEGNPQIRVSRIEIANEYIAMKGETFFIPYNISPESATNKEVTITSSNSYIVSVGQDGALSANANGEAIITVKSKDGNHETSCNVKVLYVVGLKWYAGLCNSIPKTSEDVHSLSEKEYYNGPGSYQFSIDKSWKNLVICIPYNAIENITSGNYIGNIIENKKICSGPYMIQVKEDGAGRMINYKMWMIQTEIFNKPDAFTLKTEGGYIL